MMELWSSSGEETAGESSQAPSSIDAGEIQARSQAPIAGVRNRRLLSVVYRKGYKHVRH